MTVTGRSAEKTGQPTLRPSARCRTGLMQCRRSQQKPSRRSRSTEPGLEDYEQRHFDTHRLLLISWDATSKDLGEGYGPQLGSVYELHYLEDETSVGWGVVYSGSVLESPGGLARLIRRPILR